MRRILRQRELVTDEWRYLGEDGGASDALIVPFAELRSSPSRWREWRGQLGVRVAPAENVEELADELSRLALVAVEFPNAADGRGFSHARLLRTRLEFHGELRAVGGGVKQDLIFLMARCGFDAFELAPDQNVEEAIRALNRYGVAYQPSQVNPGIGRQRFFA
jgi:uncharacterized protein (DUF934 family)